MAETLSLIQQSIDQKIGLSEKINTLISKMDEATDKSKTDYSPSN